MKTTLPLLIIFILAFSSCTNEIDQPIIDESAGRIKTVTVLHYEAIEKSGVIQKDIYTGKDISKYDRTGNLTEMNYYDLNNDVYWKYTYKYNALRKVIEENWQDCYGTIKTTYKYDSIGNKIESCVYEANGTLRFRTVFDNNIVENKIEVRWFKLNILSSIISCKYDASGNLIEENGNNEDGSFAYKSSYKYDENNNRIEWNWINTETVSRFTYQYDKMGNQTEERGFYSDSINNYKYTNIYEYNNSSEWIKKIVLKKDKPYEFYERELEFY